ncbi:MAG: hypothetical protein ACP5KB_01425 [Thermoprotei archaeon]
MRHKLLSLVLLASISVRLLPTVVTGQPFSTDVWPLIRISEELLRNPERRVWDYPLSSNYHIRWPAVMLSATLYSRLTGSEPTQFFSYVGVAALATLIVLVTYSLTKRWVNKHTALLSSLTLSSIPSFTIFTSATLKEVYAYPLALAFILLVTKEFRYSTIAILILLSVALVLSHSLTPLMITAFIASYLFVVVVKRLEGLRTRVDYGKISTALIILGTTYTAYMVFYGWGGLKYELSLSDFIVLGVFGVAVYGWYALVGSSSTKLSLAVAPVAAASVIAGVNVPRDPSILAYVLPPALLLGLLLTTERGDRESSLNVASVLLPLTTATLYISLASPILTSILHRILNYLVFAAAVTPILLSKSCETRRKILTLTTTLVFVTSLATVINAVFLGDSLTFYWKYSTQEVVGLGRVASHVSGSKLCGDAKIQYLLGQELVSIVCGLKRFFDYSVTGPPIVTYPDNFRFGYVVSPIDSLRVVSPEDLRSVWSVIYNSGGVLIWR